jgi:hypothetical protein
MDHVRLLAGSGGRFPPILVHRGSMRVIDGMHRLRAVILRGEQTVDVTFFDGDDAEAFVAGLRANIEHGLPLTLRDRHAAVRRLVRMYPDRSDRWIAGVAGLAPRTIAAIRARVTTHGPEVTSRVGQDGKLRPLDSAAARWAASKIIAERPDASLREIARDVGLAPATVHDVRQRMRRGDDPVPDRMSGSSRSQRRAAARHEPATGEADGPPPVRDVETLLRILGRDPVLRHTETGRSLLRWLSAHARAAHEWAAMAAATPPHTAYVAAELATVCAEEWAAFAATMRQRLQKASGGL